MSCQSCGQNIVNCGCNTPSSLNCCGDDENFIAETPDPAVPRKYPVPIEDAVIINSEVSLDCNSTPSSGCEATNFAPSGITRCQEVDGIKTGKLEQLYSRINEDCEPENAWFDAGLSSTCAAGVKVTILDSGCGAPVIIEITDISCT
jgi:hypothetical protein